VLRFDVMSPMVATLREAVASQGRLMCNIGFAFAGALALVAPAAAAGFAPEFRTLALGLEASDITTEGYEGFACGSNGGPPLAPISGWVDFAKCAPEANGLHEVYVEYGTRTERLSQMFRDEYGEELWIQQFGGTRIANFPVVLSLLFDDEGIVRGFRAVTDSRAELEDRSKSYLLRFRVYAHYGEEGWSCKERPATGGIEPVGEMYVNEVCRKQIDGKRVRVEAHVYRRPGQTGVDSQGMFVPGQFESMTRWEVFDATLPVSPEEAAE